MQSPSAPAHALATSSCFLVSTLISYPLPEADCIPTTLALLLFFRHAKSSFSSCFSACSLSALKVCAPLPLHSFSSPFQGDLAPPSPPSHLRPRMLIKAHLPTYSLALIPHHPLKLKFLSVAGKALLVGKASLPLQPHCLSS